MAGAGKAGSITILLLVLLFGVAGPASDTAKFLEEVVLDEPPLESAHRPEIVEQVDNVPWRREAASAFEGSEQEPAAAYGTQLELPPPDRPPDGDVPFAELEKGSNSYYRGGDEEFTGGCLAIRGPEIWQQFWSVHRSGVWPEPPAPDVDFSKEIVIACILGFWRDCCTAYVEIVGVRSEGGSYRVSVHRHEWHGLMFAITNPYHIATVPRTDGSVHFYDDYTGQRIPDLPPVP